MELLQNNPFATIKANDLNDSEINEQWVDIQGAGFLDLFCPRSGVAQYILGGKGSGKTHLMRYFSYKSQSLRNQEDLVKGLLNDGYFGIYFQASGLNGSRFEQMPATEAARNAIFQYSFELWCAGLVLDALSEVLLIAPTLLPDQASFCKELISLFTKKNHALENVEDVASFRKFLVDLSNQVDSEINNSFVKNKINIEILTNRGALIFGIPYILSKHSSVFSNLNFLYLIDELENISVEQQVYINTLIREKKNPVTFRIGARRHGIRSWETLGAREANKKDNEFTVIELDNILAETNSYENFAVDLVINRLKKSGLIQDGFLPLTSDKESAQQRKKYLKELFEEIDLNQDIVDKSKEYVDTASPIIKSFRSRLESLRTLSKESCAVISNNFSGFGNLIVEKAAIHVFSQALFKKRGKVSDTELLDLSFNVKSSVDRYLSGGALEGDDFSDKFGHYNNNYVAAALRAIRQNNMDQYHGFDNLLVMTSGFPRHILTVLRHAYRIEVFLGRTPFTSSSKISLKSQKLALKESSDWFHEDCISEGVLGTNVGVALERLCEVLRMETYADKPVECSASGFSVEKGKLSDTAKNILDWAVMIGVIIRTEQRQDKNSQKLVEKFQLNGLLCPKWGLSLARRGAISFRANDFEAILNPDRQLEYNRFIRRFESSRYVPFVKNYEDGIYSSGIPEKENNDPEQSTFDF